MIILADSIKKFNTGYFEKGELVLDRMRICENYFKNLLLYDILALFSILCHIINLHLDGKSYSLYILSQFIYTRLFSIMAVLDNLYKNLDLEEFEDYLMKFIRLGLIIIFIAHIFSCLY